MCICSACSCFLEWYVASDWSRPTFYGILNQSQSSKHCSSTKLHPSMLLAFYSRFCHIILHCGDIKMIPSPKLRLSIDTIVRYQIQLKSAPDKAEVNRWSSQHPVSIDIGWRVNFLCEIPFSCCYTAEIENICTILYMQIYQGEPS